MTTANIVAKSRCCRRGSVAF